MSLFDRARGSIPGGVSSPARAFGAVGGDPIFAGSGDGAYLTDVDGNRFIDLIQGFGSVILGHADERVTDAVTRAAARGGAVGLSTEAEVELAEEICGSVAGIERVRFMTSGTEASMTAARLARAATGRSSIVKFEGCYHGHADAFLAKAGSGVATFAVPMAEGVPTTSVSDTVVVPFNDEGALRRTFAEHGQDVAAVFVEPIAANMGVVVAEPGFLEAVLEESADAGALVVFDEVVTGFRVGRGGAQAALGLAPDLTMLGKVIGGGLPVGALGGRAEIMERLAPTGPVYQAGTFAAHPHAMAAGAAVLDVLDDDAFATLEATAASLADGISAVARDAAVPVTVVRASTFLAVFFAEQAPRCFADVQATDRDGFARFHAAMRAAGVLLPPSPFEAWFPSLAHGPEEVARIVDATARALA